MPLPKLHLSRAEGGISDLARLSRGVIDLLQVRVAFLIETFPQLPSSACQSCTGFCLDAGLIRHLALLVGMSQPALCAPALSFGDATLCAAATWKPCAWCYHSGEHLSLGLLEKVCGPTEVWFCSSAQSDEHTPATCSPCRADAADT